MGLEKVTMNESECSKQSSQERIRHDAQAWYDGEAIARRNSFEDFGLLTNIGSCGAVNLLGYQSKFSRNKQGLLGPLLLSGEE